MLSEKYNNDHRWRQELEELAALPGETVPANAVWEKLEQRLQEKKRNKKPVWYWLAAAAVVCCIFFTWVMNENKNEKSPLPLVKKTELKKDKEMQKISQTNEVLFPSVETKSTKRKQHNPAPAAASALRVILKKEVITPVVIRDLPVKDNLVASVVVPVPVNPRPVVFSTLKQKLPVVHLNEMEKKGAPIEAVAGNSDRPSIRVRLFNRDVLPMSSPADHNNILKIHLSPQN